MFTLQGNIFGALITQSRIAACDKKCPVQLFSDENV
jgi:hypothetical protein